MSLTKILKPVRYLSMVGGVASNSGKPARFVTFYQSLLLVLNLVHFLSVPFGIIHLEGVNATDLHSEHFVIKIINPLSISAVGVFSRLSVLLQARAPPLTSLENVDVLLQTSPNDLKKNALALKILVLLALLISWPFQIYSYVRMSTTPVRFLVFFINIYNNFSTTCCELQFISLCLLISARFRLLHRTLRRVKTGNKISLLKECHYILCESIRGLNRIYNAQLFISLSSLFVNALLNVYFAIFGGFTQPASGFIAPADVVNSVLWSAYYFARFVCICAAADVLINEANATKLGVCDRLRKAVDGNIKEELWNFLGHAVARKTKLTAAGFFKVDLTLITTAVATGATYLVILAQFHKV